MVRDIKGNQIKEGDSLRTKWGGVGEVIKQDGELKVAFESGDYVTDLTDENVSHRELTIEDKN
jgi:hypothetical protein|tara:strand:+ start:1818 stop:2006 length:189 start_codon:yes stop_codon:yes gene_type:complete